MNAFNDNTGKGGNLERLILVERQTLFPSVLNEGSEVLNIRM